MSKSFFQNIEFSSIELNKHNSKKNRKRNFCEENEENFKQILTEQDWDSILAIPNYCVNEQWKCLMSILIPIFNQCFPFKSSTPKSKTKYPPTSELIDCKNTLDILLVMTRTAEGYNEREQRKSIQRGEKKV
ncbi:hypothetical protein JTB14_002618 [Gonioctena quinquepunctata]|nr:hypothetical protein JTB14_002618 [Gonioctena quinquepunctata]